MKTIDKIITKVNTRFGAPLGRQNIGNRPISLTTGSKTLHLRKCHNKHLNEYDCAIPLIEGYDKGGAYWGISDHQLRVRYNKDLSYVEFYRLGDSDINPVPFKISANPHIFY